MKVIIIQADIVWEKQDENLDRLSAIIEMSNPGEGDLVVLPEMFNTGFSMNSEALAETMQGRSVSWMKNMAASGNYLIAGSLIIKDDGKYYNRLVVAGGNGTEAVYDKAHLFRMEKENQFFTRGSRNVITHYNGFSVKLQICYDLRFPVWSRNIDNSCDLLLYVANWPASRRHVWNTLLKARAIENQCYVVGVNRVGVDGNGINYCGDSQIIDPRGRVMTELESNKEGSSQAVLSLQELNEFRRKFPVWEDADRFQLLGGN
jgi:predicted amidohydrolase